MPSIFLCSFESHTTAITMASQEEDDRPLMVQTCCLMRKLLWDIEGWQGTLNIHWENEAVSGAYNGEVSCYFCLKDGKSCKSTWNLLPPGGLAASSPIAQRLIFFNLKSSKRQVTMCDKATEIANFAKKNWFLSKGVCESFELNVCKYSAATRVCRRQISRTGTVHCEQQVLGN